MAKYTQGKKGQALAYPKTLAEAVFLDENGESIEQDLRDLKQNIVTISKTLCIFREELDRLELGKTQKGQVMFESKTIDDLTTGGKVSPLSAGQGKYLKDLSDANEHIISKAFNILNGMAILASSIAAPHSASEEYKVGDPCIFGNGFYECTVPGAHLFSEDNWHKTTVVEYLLKIISNL